MALNKIVRTTALALALTVGVSSCGKGTGKNVHIDGVVGPKVAFINDTFTMTVVLTNVSIDQGLRIPIPKLPNSYVEVGPDLQSNGFLISLGIAVQDLVSLLKGKIDLVDPLTLPGGRALPGVVAGYLPGIAVEVPQWDHMVFYMGTNVFGAFVPVKIPLQNYMATFRFYDDSGDQIGNISVVGEDTNKANSGFLLLVDIAGKVAQLLGQTP
jgi:hypothetical protein